MTAYPHTRRDDTTDTLHGHEVADPYRWLEDPDSEETRAWVAEQNRLSRAHLDGLESRPWFHRTMTAIVGRPYAGTPDKVGGRYVVSRNDGAQQQNLWFVADTLDELRQGGRLLLDPNTFSEDGTSSLAGYNASKDGRWLAYLVSDGGSDWSTIRLLDLDGGHEVDDVVSKVKFSEATWLPDHSSYLYLHFPTEGAGVGTEAAALPAGRLMRHRVGEAQDGDELVLEFPDEPAAEHLARALARRACARRAHARGHVGEEPAVGAARRDRGRRRQDRRAGQGRRRARRGVRLRPGGRRRPDPLDRPRRPAGPGRATGPAGLPEDRTARLVDVVPEGEWALTSVRAVGGELLTVHLVDAQPRVSPVRPRRHAGSAPWT